MVVGVQSFELSIPGAGSLKAKRSVVKSLKDRLRRRFNVAVAETALHDRHDRAELTVAVVADGRGRADAQLDAIDAFVAEEPAWSWARSVANSIDFPLQVHRAMPRRIERLNEQLKRELAVLIRTDLRDPRVSAVTVTAVRTTADLNLARVMVRLAGSDAEKREAMDGLDAAAPFLRRALGRDLRIRRVPELQFQEDVTQERAARIEELLSEVRPEGGWDDPDGDEE